MITIKLIDARRGLYLKCTELFGDEKIAENIYNYLCEGIEECEECEPERKTGKWIEITPEEGHDIYTVKCDQCGVYEFFETNYCHHCGADMRGEDNDTN